MSPEEFQFLAGRSQSPQERLGIVLVLILGLLLQGTLLHHEWTQGHVWHAQTLIFTQIGTALIGVVFGLRLITAQQLTPLTMAFTTLCLGLRLSFSLTERQPLEISDYMISLIIASISLYGLPLVQGAVLSGTTLLTLAAVDWVVGAVNVEALAYSAFLSLLMGLLSVYNARSYAQEQRVAEIRELAVRDELTGLYNRRALTQRLDSLMASVAVDRAAAEGALVFLDLDHFKRINDTAGHPAGDQVLRRVAEILQDQTRHMDLACRWGGEEFVLLLVDLDHDSAITMIERILQVIRKANIAHAPSVTVSAGLAMLREGRTPEEVIALADARLYEAKGAGRDCLKAHSSAPAAPHACLA
ncbi:diguanylate cyclase (GGDEF) domain-containing protein [Deinococcus reticulitermitis]|uniref:Diguanylate cyclase (GGDEF) domain-containing protein n=1 Tax=Deinococcus reticulitermitis TaxID=856736 RepID=A0A1H6XSU8_9DEIO|nr:GGDEF domain-containing protein [Deinococcus reticulitermitis]SEJ32123.1 diguanylate cyclase (GGDEF) domain-containing protein [Deinococcus reticulitermitis]